MDAADARVAGRRVWSLVPQRLLAVAVAMAVAAPVASGVATGGEPGDAAAGIVSRPTTTTTTTTTLPPTTTTTTAPPTTTTTAPPTTTTAVPVAAAAPVPQPLPALPPPSGGSGALCIGDSVMLGAGPPYQNSLAVCAVVDAVESRQFSAADDTASFYAGSFPTTVVVALGTNGYVDPVDVDALVAVLAGVPRVVLVTVQLSGTREWQGAVNAELWAAAARYPNQVVIADWESYSAGHPEYFGPDGIHVTSSPAGAHAFAAVIAAVV